MADNHAQVLVALHQKVECVVARKESPNIQRFREKFQVPLVFGSIADLKKNPACFDAILVATPWHQTETILDQLLPFEMPILVEKPLALSSKRLEDWEDNGNVRNLLVGFNRTFYDFIPDFQGILSQEKILFVDAISSDPLKRQMETHGKEIFPHMLMYYSSHLIDLLVFLFGEIALRECKKYIQENSYAFFCRFQSPKGIPIVLKILSDHPINSGIEVYCPTRRYLLSPLEKLSLFEGLECREEFGSRSYLPRKTREETCDRTFKPGLKRQLEFFLKNYVKTPNTSLSHFSRVQFVTRLCEKIWHSENA